MLEHLEFPYGVLVLLVIALLFWRPTWGLTLFAAIFPMDPWSPRLPVPGINSETIMIGVALAVTVLRFGSRLPPLRYFGPVLAFAATVMIGFVVSITWATGMRAVDGGPAIWFIFKAAKMMTFTALLFYSVYWWFSDSKDRQGLLVALCVALFLSSVAGILDYHFGINPRGKFDGDRANGFLANANGMAESLGPMMFVPLYILIRGVKFSRPLRAFAAVSYGLAAVALVLSLSRGNWIAFLAAHTVFFLLVNRRLLVGALATIAILLALGAPLLPRIMTDRLEAATTTGNAIFRLPSKTINLENSTASRVVFARIGLDMFESSPIWGHGLHAFVFRTPEFGAKYGVLVRKEAHNLVVMMAAEMGLIGLSVLAWIVWAVFRCGRRLWRSDSPEYLLGAVLLAAGTHELIANLSGSAFVHVSQISAQFWILYALAARAHVERFAEQEEPIAAPAQAIGWRRFAVRSPVAMPSSLSARDPREA